MRLVFIRWVAFGRWGVFRIRVWKQSTSLPKRLFMSTATSRNKFNVLIYIILISDFFCLLVDKLDQILANIFSYWILLLNNYRSFWLCFKLICLYFFWRWWFNTVAFIRVRYLVVLSVSAVVILLAVWLIAFLLHFNVWLFLFILIILCLVNSLWFKDILMTNLHILRFINLR